MSQARLAESLGLSKTTVYYAEKGSHGFNWKLLFFLCMSYDVNPKWLLFGTDLKSSMWGGEHDIIAGNLAKNDPNAIKKLKHLFSGKARATLYFPTVPDTELWRSLKKVEELYLEGGEFERGILRKFLEVTEGMAYKGIETEGIRRSSARRKKNARPPAEALVPYRKQMYKMIPRAAEEAGIDKDRLRELILEVYGRSSMRDLTTPELQALSLWVTRLGKGEPGEMRPGPSKAPPSSGGVPSTEGEVGGPKGR